jgi:hypothetical protein
VPKTSQARRVRFLLATKQAHSASKRTHDSSDVGHQHGFEHELEPLLPSPKPLQGISDNPLPALQMEDAKDVAAQCVQVLPKLQGRYFGYARRYRYAHKQAKQAPPKTPCAFQYPPGHTPRATTRRMFQRIVRGLRLHGVLNACPAGAYCFLRKLSTNLFSSTTGR